MIHAKVTIDNAPMDIDYADEGQWRSYELWTAGDNYDDMFSNAQVTETDSDGGEIRNYSLASASNEVRERGEAMITQAGEEYNARLMSAQKAAVDDEIDRRRDERRARA